MFLGGEITLRIKLTVRPGKCISIPGKETSRSVLKSKISSCSRGIVGEAFFFGVKQPEREADHAPASSAEVKNDCSYICSLPSSCHEARSDLNL